MAQYPGAAGRVRDVKLHLFMIGDLIVKETFLESLKHHAGTPAFFLHETGNLAVFILQQFLRKDVSHFFKIYIVGRQGIRSIDIADRDILFRKIMLMLGTVLIHRLPDHTVHIVFAQRCDVL